MTAVRIRERALDQIEVNANCSGYSGLLGRIMLTFVFVTVNLEVGFGRLMEQDRELHQKMEDSALRTRVVGFADAFFEGTECEIQRLQRIIAQLFG